MTLLTAAIAVSVLAAAAFFASGWWLGRRAAPDARAAYSAEREQTEARTAPARDPSTSTQVPPVEPAPQPLLLPPFPEVPESMEGQLQRALAHLHGLGPASNVLASDQGLSLAASMAEDGADSDALAALSASAGLLAAKVESLAALGDVRLVAVDLSSGQRLEFRWLDTSAGRCALATLRPAGEGAVNTEKVEEKVRHLLQRYDRQA